MKFTAIFADDRAVSPVIGIILMVAITVILAAVLGTFVLGFQDRMTTTPQAQFEFDASLSSSTSVNDTVTVVHSSGDTIDAATLNASVADATTKAGSSLTFTGNLFGDAGEVSAGDAATLDGDDFAGYGASGGAAHLDLEGATVRVVYESPDSDETATLSKQTVE